MLISTRELLRDAYAGRYAIGAFNTYNLEITNAIVRAAEELNAPVILQLNAGALRYGGYAQLVALTRAAAETARVPVALHLDHATTGAEIERAISAGFTSVMIDGSKLEFEENVALTHATVQYAHERNIPVEAELGRLSGSEDSARTSEPAGEMTDARQAREFVAATGVDFMAVCIGNVHGFYAGEPFLDLARLDEIHACLSVPLVLHGTSGLSDDWIRAVIARGISKFNLNTELRVAFFDALAQELAQPHTAYDLPALMRPAIEAVQRVVLTKLESFQNLQKTTTRN